MSVWLESKTKTNSSSSVISKPTKFDAQNFKKNIDKRSRQVLDENEKRAVDINPKTTANSSTSHGTTNASRKENVCCRSQYVVQIKRYDKIATEKESSGRILFDFLFWGHTQVDLIQVRTIANSFFAV